MFKYSGKSNIYLIIAVITLLYITILDICIIHDNHNNYEEKIAILEAMLESDNSETTAVSLLKGIEVAEYNDSFLDIHGYTYEYKNIYYKEYIQAIIWTLIISIVSYILILFLVSLVRNREISNKNQGLKELELIIRDFRNGIYNKVYDMDLFNDTYSENNIYIQLESLGNHFDMLSKQMLSEKESTKSLVTDISHQLKTPVAALKTCFEILQKDDLLDNEREEFSMRCSMQLNGLENLMLSLINISRMEIGMIDIKKENASIFDTLVESVNRVYLKAEDKQISIEVDCEDNIEKLSIPHDRKWISEAFINILENAIKYSASNTSIIISIVERTSFLRIEITDNGIGIPKEEYNNVFKRFYRVQSEDVNKQSGSGIGLYLTREIITRHNGTISVSSKYNKDNHGSTFTIQLPYKD